MGNRKRRGTGGVMAEEKPIHPDTGPIQEGCIGQPLRDTPLIHLKSLARKVLSKGVSPTHPLGGDTPIHPTKETDTPRYGSDTPTYFKIQFQFLNNGLTSVICTSCRRAYSSSVFPHPCHYCGGELRKATNQ